jgi:cytidylate kinase
VAPLRRAEDAINVDSTRMGFQEQVDRIVGLARARGLGDGAEG